VGHEAAECGHGYMATKSNWKSKVS
jgi:acetone carboxylase gamma subunit